MHKTSTLLAVGPESIVKNLVIAAYFSLGSAILTAAKLFFVRDISGQALGLFTLGGLILIAGGSFLVIPRRARNGTLPLDQTSSEAQGPEINSILPESLAKNVVIAIYFALGAWFLIASKILHFFGVSPEALLRTTIVGLVWVCYGAFIIIPSRRRKRAEATQA